mgnify:CR=1 FL=1
MGTLGYDPYDPLPLRAGPRLDTFARCLADVHRGLVRIGWDESTATEFVDEMNDNRYECIKLRKDVEELKRIVAELREKNKRA